MDSNPFAALFQSSEDVSVKQKAARKQLDEVNALLSKIFLFTFSDSVGSLQPLEVPRYCVFLPHLALAFEGEKNLTLENFTLCIDERLQISENELITVECSSGISKGLYSREHALEPSSIRYLAHCYSRADLESKKGELPKRKTDRDELDKEIKLKIIKTCKQQIVETASAVACEALANSKTLTVSKPSQFVSSVIEAVSSGATDFFLEIAELHRDNLENLTRLFGGVLDDVFVQLVGIKLSTVNLNLYMDVLYFLSSSQLLANVLTSSRCWIPLGNPIGRDFEQQTILGKFLSPSSIKDFQDFFPIDRELYRHEVENSTASIRHQLDHNNSRVHRIFNALLRASPASRKAVISWLTVCLDVNKGRGKMMAALAGADLRTDADDGFFLNLSWVLLNLCVPFLSKDGVDFKKSKASLIDVTYCCVANKEAAMTLDPGGALVDFSQDSKLVSREHDEDLNIKPCVPFNFVTHCFFLTHKSLMLGMTLVIEKLKNLLRQYSHAGPPFRTIFFARILGVQAHLFHPTLIDLCLRFYATTAQWIVHLVMADGDGRTLPEEVPIAVRLIPECLVDNLANIITAVRQMESEVVLSEDQCKHFLSLATVLMGSSRLVRNPHIRAKLAQFVHFIIYRSHQKSALDLDVSRQVLESHELAKTHLLSSLLSIFIEIEFTGESMEFEDKFVYREPMYEILEFLWELPSFRPSIDRLATEVLQSNFEEDTPLFLKFINMVINDATVQLDESLSNLQTIKEIEELQSSERWEELTPDEKKSEESKLKEAEMMAKNRNQLASTTVHALEFITKDTCKPFVIPSMVNRIASMLNYVLKKLVGRDSRNLKVRDTSKYFFDPRTLVISVVSVYINLSQEKHFVEAVVRDDRSFSLDLLYNAERVISKVTVDSSVVAKWKDLIVQVQQQHQSLQDKEAILEDAPTEFLDPITSELMEEPVILPTSGMTMDKKNIIRHLLSITEDPFNRKHLVPSMLEPNDDMLKKIKDWKKENGIE